MSALNEICYLIASITFVIGLRMMGNPKTARKGNLIGAGGMLVAILGTILFHEGEVSFVIYFLICLSILIGTVIGWFAAKKVAMTKMPEKDTEPIINPAKTAIRAPISLCK